jgi:hypothetical protein
VSDFSHTFKTIAEKYEVSRVKKWFIIGAETDVQLQLLAEDLVALKFKLIRLFVDSNRAADVFSYGVGAGVLVVGLAVFAFATKKKN